MKWSESGSVVSDSLQPHRLYSPWNSPGQNTGVGSLSLLQGIFPTQGSNPGLLHCRQILYQLSHKGSPRPRILEWVAYPFSSGSSWSRNRTRVSCIAGGLFTNWTIRVALFYYFFLNFTLFYFTILCWFCHTSTWICHGCTRVPSPEPPSHLPPSTISLGHPSAPALSILYAASNLDWRFVSYMVLYIFQCHSPKSSHPLPLPQSPKICSIHLCLFFCLVYKVIVTIFLNSIYMC